MSFKDNLPRLHDTKYLSLTDPLAPDLYLMVPIPKETPWGVLEPLRETFWSQFIFEVSGDVFSRANLKDTRPLRRLLGRPPEVNAKQLPLEKRVCSMLETCPIANAKACRVPAKNLPLCFSAPEVDPQLQPLVTALMSALNSGIYAVVVIGAEFVL